MWRPKDVGEVIAERELRLRGPGRKTRRVIVRFGRPVRAPRPEKGDPWWCPISIEGLGRRHYRPIAGEDSLQTITIALLYVENFLVRESKKLGGRVAWGDDSERPIFFHTHVVEMYEAAITNLLDALNRALRWIEHESERTPTELELLQRAATSRGFARRRASKRKK
jgi:hypothetical protein